MRKQSLLMCGYLVRNPLLVFLLIMIDFFTLPFKSRKRLLKKEAPKKILLSNIAHLGDVVIATSVLPVLKKAFPDAKIGFLINSKSYPVLKDHPLVDKVHFFDHWKISREPFSLWTKIKRHFKTYHEALHEIKEEGYDVAIDLYFYFPNSISLFWRANIAKRIGFQSGGLKNLLTDAVVFENKDQYVSKYYLELLSFLPIEEKYFSILKPTLPSCEEGQLKGKYILMHMGAGSDLKRWPLEKWRKLTQKLTDDGYILIFTGRGREEKDNIDWVTKGFLNIFDFCDKLSFSQLQTVVKRAGIVVCVDSVVSHLAGAYDVSAIILFSGINNYHHWTPPKANIFPVSKELECAPCYKRRGCIHMNCLRDIDVAEVLDKVKNICNMEKKTYFGKNDAKVSANVLTL
jgi:ADP-heptose:LPS heptosyltransferase